MKQNKSKSGSALIFVLVFMVLGVMLGTAMIFLTRSDMHAAVTNMQYEQTYYDAESASQMATQLAIHRINNNIVSGEYNSPLTYSQSVPINVITLSHFPAPIPENGPLIEDRFLKMYEFAWDKQGLAVSGIDYAVPTDPTDTIAMQLAENRRAELQEDAADVIRGNLNTLAAGIETTLLDSGITADVNISFNQADLERDVYCVNARDVLGSGVAYDYVVRWALKPDSLIFIDVTVKSRTLRAVLTFRGQEVTGDLDPAWSEEALIRVSQPLQAGTGVGAVHDMPTVLLPVKETSVFMTNYNPDSAAVVAAYRKLYEGIAPMYREVMNTKTAHTYSTSGADPFTGHGSGNGGSSSSIIVNVTSADNIVINGEWAHLESIFVEGSGTVTFGFGAENGSDAFYAPNLKTIHAPDANIVFADCELNNMEHCCMKTVTFGGVEGFGTHIFHADRDSETKPYCEMIVGGADSVPLDPDAAAQRVTFRGKVRILNDTIIYSAGSIGGTLMDDEAVSCNTIFFAVGDITVPFTTMGTINSPQFYTWGDLSVSDPGGLRGVYACSGTLTVGNRGNFISAYLIGSTVNFSTTPSSLNCNLTPVSNVLAPLPDLFAEDLKWYMLEQGVVYGSKAPFDIITVLSENMSAGLVSVVTEGELNDIRIDPGNLFFDGIRELR